MIIRLVIVGLVTYVAECTLYSHTGGAGICQYKTIFFVVIATDCSENLYTIIPFVCVCVCARVCVCVRGYVCARMGGRGSLWHLATSTNSS